MNYSTQVTLQITQYLSVASNATDSAIQTLRDIPVKGMVVKEILGVLAYKESGRLQFCISIWRDQEEDWGGVKAISELL